MAAASDAALGSTLFGGMIASAFVTFFFGVILANNLLFHRMYGVLICQMAWYYRAFPKDPMYLKILVSSSSSRSIFLNSFIRRLGFYVSYESLHFGQISS